MQRLSYKSLCAQVIPVLGKCQYSEFVGRQDDGKMRKSPNNVVVDEVSKLQAP